MKQVFSIAISFILSVCGFAQNVAINTTGSNPHPSAILDISADDKGVLIPRLPTSERQSILDPAEGLLVYDMNTKSFWYFSADVWHEIPTDAGMIGPASGDLSGSFPNPNVIRLQNRNVDGGLPSDRYALKWDNTNNTWKGMKDSLSLPFIASTTTSGPLFSITQENGCNGCSAVKGKTTSAGSGLAPSISMAVWGDNSNGLGVMGTSNTGIGTYGLSFQNHGIYGYSTGPGFAGVQGNHASLNGIGVMGSMSVDGTGVLGRMTGTGGVAGMFETTFSSHADTTLLVKTSGVGPLSSFELTNSTNIQPVTSITSQGLGNGLSIQLNNPININNAINVMTQGVSNGLNVITSLGKAAVFTTNDPIATNTALTVNNYGVGSSAVFKTLNATSSNPAVSIEQSGPGRSLLINATNASATLAAMRIIAAGNHGLDVTSNGTMGTLSYAGADYGVGVHGNSGISAVSGIGIKGTSGNNGTNGIGVLGFGGTNDPGAIGVKGLNTSASHSHGAITGINAGGGVGVYGESISTNGVGILGMAGLYNNSTAAQFKNVNANNTMDVVSITSNGLGRNLFILNTHLTNTSPLLHIKNAGDGDFYRLENNLGNIKTSINADGNISTDGTLTVRDGLGIIRSSNSTQRRYESFNTETVAFDGNGQGNIGVLFVDFPTPFSTPPDVIVAQTNFVSGNSGSLLATVSNVTATGCWVNLINLAGTLQDVEVNWRLVVIGAE